MTRASRSLCAILAVAGLATTMCIAQPTKDPKPADTKPAPAPAKPAQPEKPKPPAGEKPGTPVAPPGAPSPEEMAAMMAAATPGEMHKHLMKDVGTWEGTVKMWMDPKQPPQESKCTTVMTSMFEGRYLKGETDGEMPGMGPFHGFGLYGYDNVVHKFQSVWIDNFGTGIATGSGDLSADHKSLTWTMTMNDPATKKVVTMREVDRHTSDDAMVLEMFGPDRDGKEFKMMEINYTRKGAKLRTEAPKPPAGTTKTEPPAKK